MKSLCFSSAVLTPLPLPSRLSCSVNRIPSPSGYFGVAPICGVRSSFVNGFRPNGRKPVAVALKTLSPVCQEELVSSVKKNSTPTAIAVLLVFTALVTSIPTLCAMVISLPLLLFERKKRTVHCALMRQWLRLTLFMSAIRVDVLGAGYIKPGTLVIANRQSPLDVLVLATLPSAPRFLLPARVFMVPIIGWIFHLAGCIAVKGTDRKAASKALDAATEILQAGSSVILFPEGKPGKNGSVGRFLTPNFKAARHGSPIVPVSVSGGWDICDGAVVPVRWGSVSVVVHAPLVPGASEKELSTAAYEVVKNGLPRKFRTS